MVVFGFSPDIYTVAESVEAVNIGVEFLQGSLGDASIIVQLSLATVDGTAQGNSQETMIGYGCRFHRWLKCL